MDYPCVMFDDFSFGFIMLTNKHTQTESHTDAAKRFTPATVVGVSNNNTNILKHEITSCESEAWAAHTMVGPMHELRKKVSFQIGT